MSKPKILIQLDCDAQASVFDSVVAVDAGVDHVLRHQAVRPEQVRDLVHGAIFTRGVKDLKDTAIFVGGSDVRAAEDLMVQVTRSFFGPMRVSVLFDANGANTTAAAAVLQAARHAELSSCTATVLGATGPVGRRAVQLLAQAGAVVRATSRSVERAESVCREVRQRHATADVTAFGSESAAELARSLQDSHVVIAAGAAGVELLSVDLWRQLHALRVAIDLNAVPPAGIAVVAPSDAGTHRDGAVCYGALGVGGLKMKIHKAAIQALFTANDQVLDAQQVHEIGRQLQG